MSGWQILVVAIITGALLGVISSRKQLNARKRIVDALVGRRWQKIINISDGVEVSDQTLNKPEEIRDALTPQAAIALANLFDDLQFASRRDIKKALRQRGWIYLPESPLFPPGTAVMQLRKKPAAWLIGIPEMSVSDGKIFCEIGRDEWVFDEKARYLINNTLPACILDWEGERRMWGSKQTLQLPTTNPTDDETA